MEHKNYLENTLENLKKELNEKQQIFINTQKSCEEEKNKHRELVLEMAKLKQGTSQEILMRKQLAFDKLLISYSEKIKSIKDNDYSLIEVEKDLYQSSLDFSKFTKYEKIKSFNESVKQKEDLVNELLSIRSKNDLLEETFEKRIDNMKQQINNFQQITKNVKSVTNSSGDLNRLMLTLSKEKAYLNSLEEQLNDIEVEKKRMEQRF